MTAAVLRPQPLPNPRATALRDERDAIERRQWFDIVRLDQIRAELAELAEEGRLDA